MERYSMKADNIKNIISDIDHLPYRAILFDGTWGIGKSYAVNEALEANPNVCKISMFGLKDPKQIYHEALFQLALKNNIGGKIGEIANNVLDGLSKIQSLLPRQSDNLPVLWFLPVCIYHTEVNLPSLLQFRQSLSESS